MANARAASRRPRAVALVGVGNVGSTLMAQLQRAGTARQGLPQLLAVCNSRRMVLRRDPASWQGDAWQRRLEDGESSDLDAFTDHVERHDGPVAIVDATASGAIAARHTAE
jgi:homoserine dehydrogenase